MLNRFIMFNYLRNIDARWQDHLENLEALREAVYLRAYSQKNPLLEYKLEGFQIFDEMLMGIKTDIARTVFRVRIEREPARGAAAPRAAPVQAVHGSFGQFGVAGPTASTAVTARPAAPAAVHPVTVQRSVPKVGRNDPCPCGSGKKYKYCHGA